MLCYGPLVSELGGQSAWCPSTPSLGGGAVAPGPPGSAAYAPNVVTMARVKVTDSPYLGRR